MTHGTDQNWRNANRVDFIKGFYQTGHIIDSLFDLYERTEHLSHSRVDRLLERNLRVLKDLSHMLYRVADEEGVDRRFQRYFDKLIGELWHELDKLRDNARLIESYSENEQELGGRKVRGLRQIDRQIITEARRDLPRQVRRARRLYGNLVPLFESILPQYAANHVILRTIFFSREFFNELIGGDSLTHFYRVIFRGRILEGYRVTTESLMNSAHYPEALEVVKAGILWAEEHRPSSSHLPGLHALRNEAEEKLAQLPPPVFVNGK